MSVMEPGVKPDQQSDTMQLNEADVSELGDVIRDRHLEKITDDTELQDHFDQPAVETEQRDPAPKSEHILDLTAQNQADASARLNEVYSNEAAATTDKVAETVPGSKEEADALASMRAKTRSQATEINRDRLANTPDVTEGKKKGFIAGAVDKASTALNKLFGKKPTDANTGGGEA